MPDFARYGSYILRSERHAEGGRERETENMCAVLVAFTCAIAMFLRRHFC